MIRNSNRNKKIGVGLLLVAAFIYWFVMTTSVLERLSNGWYDTEQPQQFVMAKIYATKTDGSTICMTIKDETMRCDNCGVDLSPCWLYEESNVAGVLTQYCVCG